VPLFERKQALKDVLAKAPAKIVYSVPFESADGASVLRHACQMGLGGIVSKRRDSLYRSGRQESWLKVKCTKSDNFPIIAFEIASLYLGRREGGKLLYAGKARTGYTEQVAREVRERLDPLITRKCPLDVPIKKPKATWVQPVVDAEIEYSGVTDDGLLRAAVFKGLRDDLAPVPPGAHGCPDARSIAEATMMRYTSPTLRDWRLPMVRLACDRCGRQGQYRRDTLIARYGLDETMHDLLHLIAQCPRRHAPGDACGVYYSDSKRTA
jgi:ATP-dependent DNA ligase